MASKKKVAVRRTRGGYGPSRSICVSIKHLMLAFDKHYDPGPVGKCHGAVCSRAQEIRLCCQRTWHLGVLQFYVSHFGEITMQANFGRVEMHPYLIVGNMSVKSKSTFFPKCKLWSQNLEYSVQDITPTVIQTGCKNGPMKVQGCVNSSLFKLQYVEQN